MKGAAGNTESGFELKTSIDYNPQTKMNLRAKTHGEAKRELLRKTYTAFNARDMEGALAAMHPDVEWPNGMEGGVVLGHAGVRAYWMRQWGLINPHVDPETFREDDSGRIVVGVHQVVRDLNGKVLMDRMVEHLYTIDDGLIRKMEIHELGDSAG